MSTETTETPIETDDLDGPADELEAEADEASAQIEFEVARDGDLTLDPPLDPQTANDFALINALTSEEFEAWTAKRAAFVQEQADGPVPESEPSDLSDEDASKLLRGPLSEEAVKAQFLSEKQAAEVKEYEAFLRGALEADGYDALQKRWGPKAVPESVVEAEPPGFFESLSDDDFRVFLAGRDALRSGGIPLPRALSADELRDAFHRFSGTDDGGEP